MEMQGSGNRQTGSVNHVICPYDDKTAQALIGLLVQHPHLLAECDAHGLNSTHFQGDWLTLWQEITRADAEGRGWDLMLLSDHLHQTRPVEGHHLIVTLTDCFCAPAFPSLLPEYCRKLIATQQRRELQARAYQFLAKATDPYAVWEDVLENLSQMQEATESADGPFHDGLPPFEDAATLCANPPPKPAELIEGVLHQGAKLVLGGGSKSFKTWTLADLAVSIATGTDFWGYPCQKGRVLYVNLEIEKSFFTDRVNQICAAKGLSFAPDQIVIHNLRGFACDAANLIPKIIRRARRMGFVLIIIDPIYKILGGRDENASRDMADLMNLLEKMAVQTGAAVAFGSHFAKGNASGKESIDRISGSGVFARDPDTILTMTRHEEQDAFTIEMTLRNHPPQEPFVVKHRHPLMVVENKLDPGKLKKPGARGPAYKVDDILEFLTTPLTTCDWQVTCEVNGISGTTFYRLLRLLKKEKRISLSPLDQTWSIPA